MEQSYSRARQKIIASLSVLIVTVMIVFGVKALQRPKVQAQMTSQSSNTTPVTMPSSTTTAQPTSTSTATSGTSTYKDGTYTATGNYFAPSGDENITIHLTIANDVVTDTSAESGANDPTSQQFQDDFISNYKSQVVGKAITSIHLSHVSGASLTTQGFNNALAQIETQAKNS